MARFLAQPASVRAVSRAARLTACILAALLLGACGARPSACSGELDCPAGTVCQPSGRCGPLALLPTLRAAHAIRLLPVASRSRPTRADGGDVTRLGGLAHGALLLSFEDVPANGRDASAELVLTMPADNAPPDVNVTLLVERVRPFGVADEPATIAGPEADRVVGPNTRGPVRIDVSSMVRACSQSGARRLDLAVRVRGVGELLIATGRSLELARRPRLDVYVP